MDLDTVHRRRTALILTAVATLGLLAGCTSASPSPVASGTDAPNEPLTVLVVSGETGPLAVNAAAFRDGIDIAVDQINAEGGVLGSEIVVDSIDSQLDPTKAVSLFQEYIAANGKPDFVVAGLLSGEALALAPLLTREKLIGMSSASSVTLDDPDTYPYFFGVSSLQVYVAQAVSTFLDERGGIDEVAYVVPNDALRESTEPALQAELEKVGISLTVHAFEPDAIDVSSAFTSAKESGADAIFGDAVGTVVPRLFEGRSKAGAEDILFVGGSGFAVSPFLDYTTPEQRTNFSPILYPLASFVPEQDRSPALSYLIGNLPDFENYPVTLSSPAYGFDMINIWASGVEQAGSADAEAVREALENLEASGASADDQPWVTWRTLFSDKTHYPQPKPSEYTIAEVTGEVIDTMLVTE